MSQIFTVHVSYLGFGWYVQNIYIYKYISYRLFHFGWSIYVQENTKGPIKKGRWPMRLVTSSSIFAFPLGPNSTLSFSLAAVHT
jgi:hypothetical protein